MEAKLRPAAGQLQLFLDSLLEQDRPAHQLAQQTILKTAAAD